MFAAFARAIDRFRGGGDASVTVPPMDGALRPNFRIENAPVVQQIDAPDNLVRHGGRVLFSSGQRLLELQSQGGEPVLVEQLPSEITCLAAHPSGALAIGLAQGGIVLRGGGHDGKVIAGLSGRRIVAATAAAFADADTLFVCLGSQQFAPAEWKRDLMSKNSSGSVWRVELASLKATCIADNMGYPYGVAVNARGEVIVSESWRHRLLLLSQNSAARTLYGDMPGYPARLVADPGSNELWLSVFAPRMQLIEFVLREDEYRTRMMSDMAPEYWIAPSLHPSRSFLEPLQGGSLKQLGEMKPWAPSRSYGLVVRLDPEGQPLESMHSRANGTRHGVTSCLPHAGAVLVASKGGGVIAAVEG